MLEAPQRDDNNLFRIRTVNDGVIIPDAMKEEIFKPFVRFNEQEDGKVTTGTGIGLALSRSLAEYGIDYYHPFGELPTLHVHNFRHISFHCSADC